MTKPDAAVAPMDAQWLPAIDRRLFGALMLIPILVLVGISAQSLTRPFEGLHAWGQAEGAWFARTHVRYGLGYTHGVATVALGTPPPASPQRYYGHPQGGGLLNAGMMWVFGVSEWSLRLGYLVVDVLVLLLMMAFLRRFMGDWPALLAGLVLAIFPVSAYFGLGGWLTMSSLAAFWMYLVIAGQVPDKQARWWHYVALGALLFVCVQISWPGFFYAAAIGIHYVLTCLVRRDWSWLGAVTCLLLAMLPIVVHFDLGAYLPAAALGAYAASLAIVFIAKRELPKWPMCAGLFVAIIGCLAVRNMVWLWIIYPAVVCLNYVLVRVFTRKWFRLALPIVFVMAPLVSAVLVFTVMLSGFNWDFQRIIDLYTWRAAKGEMAGQMAGGFDWAAWFTRAWEFGLTNFTLPVLMAAGAYLVYLGAAHAYRLICRLSGQVAGPPRRIAHPFPLAVLFLLPGLLQMFILRGALWPHQYWERPLGPFIAIAAALGILVMGRALRHVHRAVAVAVMAGAVMLCVWASVEGANYYFGIVWQTPQKIAMWKELNQLTPPDKQLATFDRELDSLVSTQSAAKGAVYRGEPAWYIDRVMVDANTPEQIEALRKGEKATVYLLPYPRSLDYGKYGTDARQVYDKHLRLTEYLVKRYPVINQYPGVDNQGGAVEFWMRLYIDLGLLPLKMYVSIPKYGMRPYLIFDLTRPGQPNVQPQAGPADR